MHKTEDTANDEIEERMTMLEEMSKRNFNEVQFYECLLTWKDA